MGLLDKSKKKRKIKGAKDTIDPGSIVETLIDRIYYAIKKDGKMNFKQISEKFKIDTHKVEYYANVLSKQGMVDLYYPTIGEPVLSINLPVEEVKPDVPVRGKLVIFALIAVFVAFGLLVALIIYLQK